MGDADFRDSYDWAVLIWDPGKPPKVKRFRTEESANDVANAVSELGHRTEVREDVGALCYPLTITPSTATV